MSDEDGITVTIDGVEYPARRGQMLIEVTDAQDIDVPRFCYHKHLSVAANCRMCLVEVERAPKPLPACATPVADGMVVRTRSPLAIDAQRGTMEFLLINHPLDCPICDQGGECELQDVAMGYGRDVSRYTERKRVVQDKDIGPLIATDLTRCIHCTRCVRFGDEIAGLPELGATGRGENMEIGTYVQKAISSELSGNVIDLCPVGALTAKPSRYTHRPWELVQHPAIAAHDCVGSNVYHHVRAGCVMRTVPREHPDVNETWISDRDRYSYQGVYSDDRLLRPLLRRDDGGWDEVDWDVALEATARRLRRVVEREGVDSLAGLASVSSSLEELYLFQRLLRAMGSNHVDHRLHLGDFRDQQRAPLMPWLGRSLASLEELDGALLIGSELRKDQPMVAHRLRKAALRGTQVSLLNPRGFDWHFPVADELVAAPGEMAARLAGVLRAAAELSDTSVAEQLVELAQGEPDEAQRRVARSLVEAGEGRAVVLLGSLAEYHPDYARLRALAAALAEVTGADLGNLSRGANAAGAWLAGCLPHRGAAGEVLAAAGRDASDLLEHGAGAFLLLGVEPELEAHDPAGALASLRRADCVVCLTPYATPAMRDYADVLLPVGASVETGATYVNVEGYWQTQGAVAQPLGEARPAWKVLRVLADALGLEGLDYRSEAQLRGELKERCQQLELSNRLAPAELPPARMGGDQLQRCGHTPIYAVDAVVRRATALQQTPDAASIAVTLHPGEAERLGLLGLERVGVRQGEATAVLPLRLDPAVAPGCAWIPAGTAATAELGAAFGPVSLEGL